MPCWPRCSPGGAVTLERLADTAPAALVVLIALGFVTAVTLRALSILDRFINRKDDDE